MSSKLTKKNKFIKDKSDDKLQYIKMNTERYIDRIDFVISFLSFLNHAKSQFHTKPGVYGSFIRKIFEFPYALLEFINSDENDWKKYGNFMDGDIDFYIQKHESNCKSDNELREIVNKMDIQLGIYLATKQEDHRPIYGKYYYLGSTNTSEYFNMEMNVAPCCITKRLFFQSEKEKLTIDLSSCVSDKSEDLSVNSLLFNSNGMSCSQNFLEVLEQIKSKNTKILSHSFKNNESITWYTAIPRRDKVINLNKNVAFIKKRILKIMDKGYSIEGYNIPKIEIEKKEDCCITGIKAPYPTISLECGHSLSFMAYTGIINKGENEYTESIRCPLCRKDLKLDLIHRDRQVQYYINHTSRYFSMAASYAKEQTDDKIRYEFDSICSKDAIAVINENSPPEDELEISDDDLDEVD